MDRDTIAAIRRLDRHLAPSLAVPDLDRVCTDQFVDCLHEYAALVDRHHPELELNRLPGAVAQLPPQTRSALVHALLSDDAGAVYDLATEAGAAPEQLYFVGELAARPFLWAFARGRGPSGPAAWATGGRCPVCGRRAHMGHIDATNVKYLHCPACETVWRTARVGCPFCTCEEPGRVGYFTLEGDAFHRVEYCAECGGYLKVVDQRAEGREVDFLLEDAATAHLDQVAMAEGYHR